jgi:hypothetical protein
MAWHLLSTHSMVEAFKNTCHRKGHADLNARFRSESWPGAQPAIATDS